MKRRTLIFLPILLVLGHTQAASACSSLVAGKKTTANGAVLFGHNEDDYGQCVINTWHVPRAQHAPGAMVTLRRGGQVEQVAETWAYTWFQCIGQEFSDYYVNEWNVHIASDACRSREDNPELTEGGIGYWLRRLVAERARNAREGVEIAGALLDRFGYASSGRTYVICDPNEGWLLSAVEGKHWAAQRVPDDQVVFLPNQYVIREFDFEDQDNFLSSADNIRDYAIAREWYDPKSGKPFDFAKAYTYVHRKDSQFAQRGYDTRQWAAQRLLTGKAVTIQQAKKTGLPFGVKPNRKLDVADIQAVLRHHFEGTPYAPAYDAVAIRPGTMHAGEVVGTAVPSRLMVNPNATTERTICTLTTVLSTVAELRSAEAPLLQSLLWVSYGRPDCNVYIPWYTQTRQIPPGYQNTPGIDDPGLAVAHHFDPVPGALDYDADAAFWIFNELENLVDRHYIRLMETVRPTWQADEATLFSLQPQIEATAKQLIQKNNTQAVDFLTRYTEGWIARSINRAKAFNQQFKSQFYH